MSKCVCFERLDIWHLRILAYENYLKKKKPATTFSWFKMNASMKVKLSHMTQQIFLDPWEVIIELFLHKIGGLHGTNHMSSSFLTIRHWLT